MQLLDATLAMALTLAALATIVTIFMEAGLRAARMRKKNLIELMKLLNEEISEGPLKLSPEKRWDFICRVVQNPLKGVTSTLTDRVELETWFDKLCTDLSKKTDEAGATALKDSDGKLTDTGLEFYLNQLGQDRIGKRGNTCAVLNFIGQFLGDNRRSSLYDRVSLEHFLRRLSEAEEVQALAKSDRKPLEREFNRLARKYEEFGSAVSADFKRTAQAWSIFVGIAFAILVNVDGLRIFEAYQADKELTSKVIAQQSTFEQAYEKASEAKNQRESIEKRLADVEQEIKDKKEKIPSTTDDTARVELQQQLKSDEETHESILAELAILTSVEQIEQTAGQAQQQLTELAALGIPLGWNLYPNCPYGDDLKKWQARDPKCRLLNENLRRAWSTDNTNDCWLAAPGNILKKILDSDTTLTHAITTFGRDTAGFLRWLFAVTITGILIGLGAPFWFDVAKRLSQVRQGIRENATTEERLSGKNANGDPEQREKIVKTIVSDISH